MKMKLIFISILVSYTAIKYNERLLPTYTNATKSGCENFEPELTTNNG